ncbi:hypothetical protein LTR60_002561, partial [Cryomyces antarcticus]
VTKAEREARHKADALAAGGTESKSNSLRAFWRESSKALKQNWVLLIYMVILMTGFNSCSHGSQDFYPTFLKDTVRMSATKTTVITVVGQIGALLGGTTIGYLSSVTGRRLTMMCAAVAGAAIVPAYVLPRDLSLIASVFFEQFFVGGIWGPIPVHLIELSPPALRSLIVGLTYQLGNLASSASATIQGVIGERYPLPPGANGTKRFAYGKVIGIFMGAVWVYLLLFLFLGPEMSQQEREVEAEAAMQFERLRAQGVSLAEIGASRAKGQDLAELEMEFGHRNAKGDHEKGLVVERVEG